MSLNDIERLPNGTVKVNISTEAFPDARLTLDEADWNMVENLVGKISATARTGGKRLYAQAKSKDDETKVVMVHRLLMPGVQRVGWKNGDSMDCRRGNLCDVFRKNFRKALRLFKNDVELLPDGNLMIDVSTKMFPDAMLIVHPDDWSKAEKIKDGRAFAYNANHDGIPYARISTKTSAVLIHRLVKPDFLRFGWRNGNTLDCRRENLYELTGRRVKHPVIAHPPVSPHRDNTVKRLPDGNLSVDISTPNFPDARMRIHPDDWNRIVAMRGGKVYAYLYAGAAYAKVVIPLGDEKVGRFVHRLLKPDTKHVWFKNDNTLDCHRENLCSTKMRRTTRNEQRESIEHLMESGSVDLPDQATENHKPDKKVLAPVPRAVRPAELSDTEFLKKNVERLIRIIRTLSYSEKMNIANAITTEAEAKDKESKEKFAEIKRHFPEE